MNMKAMAEDLEIDFGEFMYLLEYFVERSGSDLKRLESAVKSGDTMEVVTVSHSIKGSAGNLGLMNIFEIAKEIEAKGIETNLDCEEAVLALKEALDVLGNTVKYGNMEN
jgi:HPt (histidine-containing phosphotransfer) domain-containing protein